MSCFCWTFILAPVHLHDDVSSGPFIFIFLTLELRMDWDWSSTNELVSHNINIHKFNDDLQVSRNNFVAHCKTERMIVSKEGTVRGIRHRVSKIKMDMMGSLHIDQDKCLLQKQVTTII